MYEYARKSRNHISGTENHSVPDSVQSSLNSINNVDIHSGTKLNLEDGLKSRIEQSIGFKLDGVEMRESHDAADMDAKAFAKGNVVHFAPGQFRPETEEGRNLITHELSHVAQQARGGVHADIAGLNVNTSEALENQADSTRLDFSSPVDTSSLPSLPSMDAQAAPVQGAFGGIKKFFGNMKKSFGFGKKAKEVDKVTQDITNEHQAETDEMMKAMQSQGFSPEEIEAQLLFQRINKSGERARRFQAAQGAMVNYGMNSDLDDDSQMNNIFARAGRGKLRKSDATAAGQKQQDLLFNIIAARPEEDRANALTNQIGQKYAKMNRAKDFFSAMNQDRDTTNKTYDSHIARYNKAHNTNFSLSGGNTHVMRFLNRHLNGLDEQSADALMGDMLSGDKARMAPHIKNEVDRFMNQADENLVGDNVSDDELLDNALQQTLLNQDNMSVSDLVGNEGFGADTLGVSQDYIDRYMQKKNAHSLQVGKSRGRLKRMAGMHTW